MEALNFHCHVIIKEKEMGKKEPRKLVANNKKAYHDYFIDETYEAGIALHGTEVKSMRLGKCSIKESFIRIENGEVYVYGMHVSPYEKGNLFNKDPLRVKKLLLHRAEINKLQGRIKEKGYTLVPLEVYFNEGKAKVQIGLARGKKLYDKRESIAKKDQMREAEKEFKVKMNGY
jgi:SsrA-binding protein